MSLVTDYSADVCDEHGDLISGVQYAVTAEGRDPQVYGDQHWVASGQCIRDGSWPDGRIVRRSVTVIYGRWEDAP